MITWVSVQSDWGFTGLSRAVDKPAFNVIYNTVQLVENESMPERSFWFETHLIENNLSFRDPSNILWEVTYWMEHWTSSQNIELKSY